MGTKVIMVNDFKLDDNVSQQIKQERANDRRSTLRQPSPNDTIDGRLDLHRHTVKEAREALFAFLDLARRRGWRTVLVLHGRGERSATPARIKSYVAHWLTQVPDLIAWHSADRRDGGTGAVYVMLRKTPEARERARERHGLKTGD